MSTLPIISVWQPWASLLVAGAKRIETRGWRFPLPLPCCLAIHAAKKWDENLATLCVGEPFLRWLKACDMPPPRSGGRAPRPVGMPFGAVVGVVRVGQCWTSERAREVLGCATGGDVERAFGDYGPGRYGWVTDARMRLAEPVPLRGQQGIWRWEPTAEA